MENNIIHLWQSSVTEQDKETLAYWKYLDDYEQQYADGLKLPRLRNRYIIIHGKLKTILADELNIKPEQVRIAKAEYGKPYLVDFPEVAFNLSHTADKMVVATGRNCFIGVDIELCKSRNTLHSLVDKCFSIEEQSYWRNLPLAQQQQSFYRFWTRKEAIVKATGRGIALGLKDCVIDPMQQTRVLKLPENYGPNSRWNLADFELGPVIMGAVASKCDAQQQAADCNIKIQFYEKL